MPWKVGFLGGTLKTDAVASGCCFGSAFTLRTDVLDYCDSMVWNLSATLCNICCCWIGGLLSGIIGCGVLSASINK